MHFEAKRVHTSRSRGLLQHMGYPRVGKQRCDKSRHSFSEGDSLKVLSGSESRKGEGLLGREAPAEARILRVEPSKETKGREMLPQRAELITRDNPGKPNMTLRSLPQATSHQMAKTEKEA